MKNYKKNCWENREKLEKINHKIKKHEIIERINKKKNKNQKYLMKQRHLKK